ncbi:hypothetical protein WBG06_10695 [Nocardioides sp. CCNWLW239]|uniref:hypothetical protein n=1 Tax=Nocardioides sp. CCNWLW239 TaxID=3128902 RepID=UPI0030179D36
MWALVAGGLAALLVLVAAGVGAFLVLGPDDDGSGGSDLAATEGTNSDFEAVTSEPARTWSWKSGDEVRWTTVGPGFTVVLLGGEAGFVVLDDDGKEMWRSERHDYSGVWVNEETETIQSSWYGPVTATADGDTTSDSGSIVYDYDGKILWKDTDDDRYLEAVEEDGYLVHDSEDKTLTKLSAPDGPGEWSIDGENVTTTDDWIYAIDGDTMARHSRSDGSVDWKIDLPAGWKGPKQWYEINLRANDDLVVVVGHATYGFSADKGAALWEAPGEGVITATAGNRFAVIEEGTYDQAQEMTMPSNGPYPIYDTSGKVGSLSFSTSTPYSAVQMLRVDGKGDQVNFSPDGGALYDAAGKLVEEGYTDGYVALDDGCYLLDRATVSFRKWHDSEDAWSLPITDAESIGDTANHRDIYVDVGDGFLVVNDKHHVWRYE